MRRNDIASTLVIRHFVVMCPLGISYDNCYVPCIDNDAYTLLYIVFKMAHSEPDSGVKGKGNITRIYQINLTVSQQDLYLKSITDKG